MKKIILGVVVGFLAASVLSYAGITNNQDGSKTFTYEISAAEWKALNYLLEDPEKWFNHHLSWKIGKAERATITVEDLSDKKFSKLTKAEKETLILNAPLKTRIERDAEATP